MEAPLKVRSANIPDKGFQLVRYYGWYSNKARGVRAKTGAGKPKTLLKAMSRIVPLLKNNTS